MAEKNLTKFEGFPYIIGVYRAQFVIAEIITIDQQTYQPNKRLYSIALNQLKTRPETLQNYFHDIRQ